MSNAHGIHHLGHTDQGGRPDGVQIMLHAGHAYVGHMFSDGITVIDNGAASPWNYSPPLVVTAFERGRRSFRSRGRSTRRLQSRVFRLPR